MEREKEEKLEMGPEFRHERTSRPRLGPSPKFKLRRTHVAPGHFRLQLVFVAGAVTKAETGVHG